MLDKNIRFLRIPDAGLRHAHPSLPKNLLNTMLYLKKNAVACADKRGTGCLIKTSSLWGYPMPGFAVLNPAYRKAY
ncbi:hypothetical protein E3226_009620 [Legionella geestiana]|nr:hypothetical protein [Legionella geestiana]QDQ40631.1 hypothetical protein E3226_009620 [Legionella geestiana]